MAYGDFEVSIEDGLPIRLYEFTMGASVWRYTSNDETLVVGGAKYLATAISDDGSRQSGEAVSDTMSIRAPLTCGPAEIYMVAPPTEPIMVRIMAMHVGLTTPDIVYVGEVIQCDYPSPVLAVLSCQTLLATMRREGVRLGWQRTCPYALYDPLTCKVNKTALAFDGTVAAVNGFTLTVPELASELEGKYTGGIVEWSHPVRGTQFLMVEQHTGTLVSVFGETGDMYEGMVLTFYPGCSRTTSACRTFNNLPNYGGAPGMPGKRPFEGEVIFY